MRLSHLIDRLEKIEQGADCLWPRPDIPDARLIASQLESQYGAEEAEATARLIVDVSRYVAARYPHLRGNDFKRAEVREVAARVAAQNGWTEEEFLEALIEVNPDTKELFSKR
jgi:hypothetical protein